MEKAGNFVDEDPKDIGIYIVFGLGNGVTPEEAGQYAVRKLTEYADEQGTRANYFFSGQLCVGCLSHAQEAELRRDLKG